MGRRRRRGFRLKLPWRITPMGRVVLVAVVLCVGVAIVAASCQRARYSPAPVTDKQKLTVGISSKSGAPDVRVWMKDLGKDGKLTIAAHKGSARTQWDTTISSIEEGERLVMESRGGILIEEPMLARSVGLVSVEALDGGVLNVNGLLFRGKMTVTAGGAGKGWTIINTVSLEDYARGSLGWEMIAGWPVEALKAQAVAIRTYVLFHIFDDRRDKRVRDWDVDNTTWFLRYGGIGPLASPGDTRETANVLRAVSETAGEVMLYDGDIFKAYFSACSGGRTTSSTTAFGQETIEPLSGADLGSYGRECSLFTWSNTISLETLARRLSDAGKSVGEIKGIDIRTDSSDWAYEVVVRGDGEHEMSAQDFRRAVGTGREGLPSACFTAEIAGDSVLLEGRGWGHGVGLDQWASAGMAKDGKNYRDILEKMYPGAELATPWK